ncbi:MAG: nucleotide exchange factor GrpE [bacterium]|nr:nucleotide exchange factor GrpE [bacterium]
MRREERISTLARLQRQIDFTEDQYYNLYFGAELPALAPDLASEAWTGLSNLTADMTKLRGELYRLSRGVEQLRLPAIEAVGLDKVAEQLRGLEVRLRPLGELLNKGEDEGKVKRLLEGMLDVIDALDRVFELMERQPESISQGVMTGLKAVYQLLQSALKRAGLEALEVGTEFDPHRQLAMGVEPNADLPNGAVSRVLLRGYLWNGNVFRTAQVVVVRNEGQ